MYRHIYKMGRTKLNPELQQALQLYNDVVSKNHPAINGINEPLIQSKYTSGPHFSYRKPTFGNIPNVVAAIQAPQLDNGALSNNHPAINYINEPLVQSKHTSGPHFSYSNPTFGNIPHVVAAIQYPLATSYDSIAPNPKGNELASNDHGTNEPVAHINNHQIVVFKEKELTEAVPKTKEQNTNPIGINNPMQSPNKLVTTNESESIVSLRRNNTTQIPNNLEVTKESINTMEVCNTSPCISPRNQIIHVR